MKKIDVYQHYKTLPRIAKALGISKSAVSQWPDIVPEGSAYKLEVLTKGRLTVDRTLYGKRRQGVINAA
jgi:transcriptional regulator with XRE-family HTH domain